MLRRQLFAAAIVGGALLPGGAFAATAALVTTDLNMRAGPDPSFQVVDVIPGGTGVAIAGCTQTMNWCQVSWNGQTGWAYAKYLAYDLSGTRVMLSEARTQVEIPVVTPPVAAPVTTTVGIIQGTVDAALAITPPPTVRTYVVDQEVEPVYLEVEPVVGTVLPETVTLNPIPDYDYRFAYINQQRVLVEPGTRRVVYVVR
jgi:uncharacterized protein YraI